MSNTNLKVGLFVLAAVVLIVAGALSLGLGALLRPSLLAETYIDESVQGLDKGSPVKYRGVQIGTVSDIGFVTAVYPVTPSDPNFIKYSKLVLIRLSLQSDTIARTVVGTRNLNVDVLVGNGLRVRLTSQGLTGTAYLEIDFLDPERNPAIAITWQPGTLYIPSAASTISRLSTTAEGVFRNLEHTDISRLVDEGSALMAELRQTNRQLQTIAGNPELQGAIANANATLSSVRRLADSTEGEIATTLAAIRTTVGEFGRLGAGLNDELGKSQISQLVHRVEALADEIRRAAGQLPEILAGADQTVRRIDGIVTNGQRSITLTLDNLATMSKNLRSFSETAARYPSQVLFGGPPAPSAPPRGNR